MNFFTGSIVEAVSLSKTKDAIFVVFVKGNNDGSNTLDQMLNTPQIRSKLESDDFVVIKIASHEQSYIQFASLYQNVPVPSIFFIGKNGKPLEIVTGVVNAEEELKHKIDNALLLHRQNENSASSSFIQAEKVASTANKDKPTKGQIMTDTLGSSTEKIQKESLNKTQPLEQGNLASKQTNENQSQDKPMSQAYGENSDESSVRVVCDGNVCRIIKDDSCNKALTESKISVEEKNNEEAKERMRKLLEQKRREKALEEQKMEKERELKRRADAAVSQNVREWQKDTELRELKQTIKREKLAEQEARERIRAQIQADRAERAQKNALEKAHQNVNSNLPTAAESLKQQETKSVLTSNDTRLQFRLPTGEHHMNVFKKYQTLGDVRQYVKNEVLANTGVKDFYLATSYPRKEFTVIDDVKTLSDLGLIPNGVILVIAKESKISPSGILSRSGGIINLFSIFFQYLVSPLMVAYGFVNTMFRKRSANNDDGGLQRRRFAEKQDPVGPSTSKEANSSNIPSNNSNDAKAYRRIGGSNIHRFADNRKDSDDENATWNGNSTQQQ